MESFAEISKKNQPQLLKDLAEARKKLFDTRYKVANKQHKATHEIKGLKKTIAQILTALKKSKQVALETDKEKQ